MKDLRRVNLNPFSVELPFSESYTAPITWNRYQIQAITYHIGMQVMSGHYRTLVKTVKVVQGSQVVEWMNYEDSRLPDRMTEPSNFQLKNLVLLWLKSDHSN